MASDAATEVLRPSGRDDERAGAQPLRWEVLSRLELGAAGSRLPDGAVRVGRSDPAGCFLYGPYLHLPQGNYRLTFRCRCAPPRLSAQPVLGVEVIVLSRFQLCWRDFTAAELAPGSAALDFAVAPEHSLEGENEGRFEFRFFHFGNADLTIDAVALDGVRASAVQAEPSRWRLLGRLQPGWIGRRDAEGGVAARRAALRGCLLYGGWPYLRLPRGAYRLTVEASCGRSRVAAGAVLEIAVFGQSRWLGRRRLNRLLRRPELGGIEQARREATAAEAAAGPLALDFVVPTEFSLEAGADAPFEIRIYRRGNAGLAIHAVELHRLSDAPAALPAPRLRPSGRRKIVIIGNCQSETLRQGFAHIDALARTFDVRYHFVQLPKNLYEYAARDLETCDVLLIQDIGLWDSFPLREAVRPAAERVRFPLVRFSSLWPFDAWNGPGDHAAHAREAPNLHFPYLDGLLARLRREIPDRESRFAAYRELEVAGVVNYRRLHELEARRLAAVDRKFGVSIGAFILENFRQRRVFHTTVRPNWEVFNQLLHYIAAAVGAKGPVALNESVDVSLRNPQVPVHPRVAEALGVAWADERTRYLNRGIEMTWETYVRSYIDHYG